MANRNLFRDLLNPIEDALVALGRRSIQEYGEIDLLGTKDCSRLVNLAFADAAENNYELVFPAGTFKTSEPIRWPNAPPRLSGMGNRTIIQPDANDFDWLTIGNGTTVGNGPGTGWVRDLILRGAKPILAAPGSSVGFVIDAVRGVEVRNVQVDYAPIGFDLRNNCFGSSFYNCRTLFDRCRIGIDLRGTEVGGGFASGNDLPFFNCWFDAGENGVRMTRGGGFYRFFGGQLGNHGGAAPNDANGSLLIDCTEGAITAAFHSMSFEGAHNAWNVRVIGAGEGVGVGARLTFDACSFFAKEGAIGLLKISDPYDETISFRDCGVHANGGVAVYSAPSLLNIPNGQTTNPNASYIEMGSYGRPIVNGSTIDLRDNSMLARAGLIRGFAMNYHHLFFNGVYLRTLASTDDLQVSGDGVAWTTLAKVP